MMTIRLSLLLILCLPLAGCDSLGYYSQAVSGQLSVLSGRQAITEYIDDPDTHPNLQKQLSLVLELRAFAEIELQLPVEGQYSDYVDLDRDYVVWNVFAAPELSLQAKTWCYPIAGCAGYRGYFSEVDARAFAGRLAEQGFDTYVGGVAAYSTLGWLDDPILNTFVFREESQLADLIFHELAHKLLYVPGDSVFNESFATAVAREGVRRWMLRKGNEDEYPGYLEGVQQKEEFIKLVVRYREMLESIYQSSSGDDEKRRRKEELIDQLRGDYESLQQKEGGSLPYTGWMTAVINNAKLNSIAMYYDLVPALEKLLAEESFQLPGFYARCLELEELTPDERGRQLRSLGGTT